MHQQTPVTYIPFGRHLAVIALAGDCAGSEICGELLKVATTAIESDRTQLVIDLRGARGIGADVLQTVRDIYWAGTMFRWRVAVVRPALGPLRRLFQAETFTLRMRLFGTRSRAIIWALSRGPDYSATVNALAEPHP